MKQLFSTKQTNDAFKRTRQSRIIALLYPHPHALDSDIENYLRNARTAAKGAYPGWGVYKMDVRGVFLDNRPPIKCDLAVWVTLAGFFSTPEINP